ncbi:hydrogenase iron-sulfur subunit [Candidatus Contubernalis alkaliaceticus]|uniref:hydrogenase iron-sulfur subunit n=1 Tax=Candidatus Contubernalis alkaliaceticus TaxID=338645 RepID=UPI001F4C430E|nr:hydrogenase iron-sulfur subunit [Candidatus Contubernalis alkalaceticus]UNC93377.1 hydrogenase iron-sulfur subunit [Candidatus Contubernalis alkalaceticus]
MAEFSPSMVTLCCENSAFLAAEKSKLSGVKAVRIPCGAQLEHVHILRAFNEGADGVLVMSCLKENCKHSFGNDRAEKKVAYVKGLLKDIGVGEDRLAYAPVAANNEFKYNQAAQEMLEKLKEMGPIEGKVKK